jgi:hypothetical protein
VDFSGSKLLAKIFDLVTSKWSQKNPRDKVCKCLIFHTYSIFASPTKVLTDPHKSPHSYCRSSPVKPTRGPIGSGESVGDSTPFREIEDLAV